MRRAGLALLLAAVVAGGVLFGPGLAGRWHPGDRAFPRQGIDVSHHQGTIDWPLLPAQGVDFVYLKASEGGDWRDPAFARNRDGARAARIASGAYHFYNPCRPGAVQAANFLAAAPPVPGTLPPAVDLEDMRPCANPVTSAALRAEVASFIRLVEARYRRPVILYLTREFDDVHAISANIGRPLWLRSLVLRPSFGARRWTLWQASSFRRLRGIEGRVDWNVVR